MADEIKARFPSDAESAWKTMCDLKAAEEHFNEIKVKCRILASTWLLASFGAMGFLVSRGSSSINLPVEVLILGIGLAAAFGLLLVWVLDLLVYHRLLDAYFSEALKLENSYPCLPQVRHNMIASQPGGQTIHYQAWFYVGTISAPLVFSGALFSYWCLHFGRWAGSLAAVVIACLVLATGYFV